MYPMLLFLLLLLSSFFFCHLLFLALLNTCRLARQENKTGTWNPKATRLVGDFRQMQERPGT